MKSRHVRDKLSEYIDGMLNEKEASAVKEHLDLCLDCMEAYEEMVKIIGHMTEMEKLETPESFLERVHERMEKQSSLQRLIKGLFFPLKIKVPLELAGVAAAALLVIYIVGIRGKQHIYELAYVQRSPSPAMLKEQASDIGSEVDEATPPIKKVQPESELEEENESKKRDKRIGVEKTVVPREKDLSALAPQEKKMEDRVETEEAMPRDKILQERKERRPEPQKDVIEDEAHIEAETPRVAMAQRREEPALELVDKEKGELEKDAFTKPITREQYVQDIIVGLGGKIIESEHDEDTKVLESITIEIPANNYPKLIQILEERGDILKPYPAIKEKDQKTVRIRLRLQQ